MKPGLLILQCWNCLHIFGDTARALLVLWCLLIFVNDPYSDEEKRKKFFSLLRVFKVGTSDWILATIPPFDLKEYL